MMNDAALFQAGSEAVTEFKYLGGIVSKKLGWSHGSSREREDWSGFKSIWCRPSTVGVPGTSWASITREQ